VKKNTPRKVRVRKPQSPDDAREMRLLKATVDFLKHKGWNVACIGGFEIRQGGAAQNFVFGVKFTGLNPKLEAEECSRAVAAELQTPGPETGDHTPAA
jgi:hypothetical protein